MTVKKTIESLLESNSTRRELTRLGKEELVTEDTKSDFRSAILKAAEDKEMITPGHILRYLEQKGKVPSEYFGRTTKAMQFIIDTITSYGGHYASANPKLMKYIDNMSVNKSERSGY